MKQVALPTPVMSHFAAYKNATLEVFYIKRIRKFSN